MGTFKGQPRNVEPESANATSDQYFINMMNSLMNDEQKTFDPI